MLPASRRGTSRLQTLSLFASYATSCRWSIRTTSSNRFSRRYIKSDTCLPSLRRFSMPSNSTAKRLIDFFDPSTNAVDPRGRSLNDIVGWPDSELEYSHDYIQNLFPLPEGSAFNYAIWLVTEDAYNTFRERPELQASLGKAFDRICTFYGLRCERTSNAEGGSTNVRVVRAEHFDDAKSVWLSRFNHNHLRITRIIRSLRVLGLSKEAAAFHSYLETDPEVIAKVSSTSRMYWKRAAERALRLPPDEDDDAADGIDWLRSKS